MKNNLIVIALVATTSIQAGADFFGPSKATHAVSPDGQVIVRIKTVMESEEAKHRVHEVSYYSYDEQANSYRFDTSFKVKGYRSHFLYVSNSGDLAFVSLGRKDVIQLFSRTGTYIQGWDLDEMLSDAEIAACAETGSTLQWLEEAEFLDRDFYFRGPSLRVRAITAPHTVMRGVNDEVAFSGKFDARTGEYSKFDPE